MVVGFVLGLFGCKSKLDPFTEEKWTDNPHERYRIVDHWIDQYGYDLETKDEIVAMLGEPNMSYLPRYKSLAPDLIYYIGGSTRKVMLVYINKVGEGRFQIDEVEPEYD